MELITAWRNELKMNYRVYILVDHNKNDEYQYVRFVCPPAKKRGYIALHMSVSLSVRLLPFRVRSITQERLDLPSSNLVHTSVLGNRGTLLT